MDPIWPTAGGLASGGFAAIGYLGQGTDLPSSALPVGDALRAMRARMMRSIAFESVLAGGLNRRAAARDKGRMVAAAGVYGRGLVAVKVRSG
ncbi:MAG: hypothetical protein ACRDGV_07750 [Candidatus Limnocylindria bacterium]